MIGVDSLFKWDNLLNIVFFICIFEGFWCLWGFLINKNKYIWIMEIF